MIQSPFAWVGDRLNRARLSVGADTDQAYWPTAPAIDRVPRVNRITTQDLRNALRDGWQDFSANRTDVLFLCALYPIVGLVLARAAFGYGVLPLLFPLASGFALVGPIAGLGLNEISRRRELGHNDGWVGTFHVLRSPSIGAITGLSLLLIALFLLWLVAAQVIYDATLGPKPPVSMAAFVHDVLQTQAGWTMIIVGCGVGFLFAALTFALSAVAFPLLLDRHVPMETAIRTSLRAVRANKRTMALWGLLIAAALAAGSLPFLLGLVIVLPVLGHATWHLYRRVVMH